MREIFRHSPGRIFLIVSLLSVTGILWIPRYFFKPHLIFGWMPLPFLSEIIFVLFKNSHSILLAFLVNTLVYVLISLLTSEPSEQIERIHYDKVKDFLTGRC